MSVRVVTKSWPPREVISSITVRHDQLVAGHDRAGVRESLVAVHHPGVVHRRAPGRPTIDALAASARTVGNVGGATTSA